MTQDPDEALAFSVATVWREQRVSCPHQDILRAYDSGALDPGAMEFLTFHLNECQCPYCNAVLEDLRVCDEEAAQPQLQDLRDKLLRSTVSALREASKR